MDPVTETDVGDSSVFFGEYFNYWVGEVPTEDEQEILLLVPPRTPYFFSVGLGVRSCFQEVRIGRKEPPGQTTNEPPVTNDSLRLSHPDSPRVVRRKDSTTTTKMTISLV